MFEEIMAQKFPELIKDTNPKIQETHTISSKNKTNFFSCRHVIGIPKKTNTKRKFFKMRKRKRHYFKINGI